MFMGFLSVCVLHIHLLCSTHPSLQLSTLLLSDMLFGHVTFCLSADQLIDIYGTSNLWSIMNIDRSALNTNSDKTAFFQSCVVPHSRQKPLENYTIIYKVEAGGLEAGGLEVVILTIVSSRPIWAIRPSFKQACKLRLERWLSC